MKSEVVETRKPTPIKPYPKLMISKDTGDVYIVTSNGHVTRVSSKDLDKRPLGRRSNELVMTSLLDFHGSVILSNEESD